MRPLFILLIGLGFLALNACHSGGDSAPTISYKPLSFGQKSQLKNVMSSLGKTVEMADSYVGEPSTTTGSSRSMRTNNTHSSNWFPQNRTFELKSNHVGTDDDLNIDEMKGRLNDDNCEMILPEGVDFISMGGTSPDGVEEPDSGIPTYTLEIKGAGCPIYMKASISGQKVSETAVTANISYQYQAFSQDFKEWADVDKMDLRGTVHASFTQSPSGEQNIRMTMNFVGNGHSQTEGNFRSVRNILLTAKITIPPNMQGPTGATAFQKSQLRRLGLFRLINLSSHQSNNRYVGDPELNIDINMNMHSSHEMQLSSFSALLEEKAQMEKLGEIEEQYLINQQPVSKEEYLTYRDSLDFPGLDMGDSIPGLPGGNQPDESIKCELTIYDSAKLSLADLLEKIKFNQPIMQTDMAQFSSCDGPQQQKNLERGYVGRVDFIQNKDDLVINFEIPGTGVLRQSFFIISDNLPLHQGKSFGTSHTLRLFCPLPQSQDSQCL